MLLMLLNIPNSNKKRVVIIGGGFGGIQLIQTLRKAGFQIVLIDKNNFHTFQPLLYQVATAGLEPDSIAYPLRKMFFGVSDFYFRMAEVKKIEPEKSQVSTDIGDLNYDYLVIATGSQTNFFGNDNVEKYSMPMKTVAEALDLRSLMLQNFEKALLTKDLSERERLMNFVIVGGGPTGVELAGALSELKNHVLPKDYPDLDFRRMDVHLLEAGPQVLGPMSEKSSKRSAQYLEEMGVKVWLNTPVINYDGKIVKTETKELPAETLIWAAGVKGTVIPGIDENAIERGRYLTDEFNLINGTKNIYAIGDVALMKTEDYPGGHPQVAPTAMQQGVLLGKNLKRIKAGKEIKPFQYKDKGSMATIGRNRAVVDFNKLHFGGFSGWLVWMLVHLLSLVGFRNKVITLLNWVWNYINYDRGVRLIIRPFVPKSLRSE